MSFRKLATVVMGMLRQLMLPRKLQLHSQVRWPVQLPPLLDMLQLSVVVRYHFATRA